MVSFYTIQNNETSKKCEISEVIILKCIKATDKRHSKLNEQLIKIWENLENKKYKKEQILEL